MPWFPRVLPHIIAITEVRPSHTIFTRFIPTQRPGEGCGRWKHYYARWPMMTVGQLGPEMVDLVPVLANFAPTRVIDKYVFSPWAGSTLHQDLQRGGIDTLIITGGETDVCMLGTVLGGSDWGFRVILVTDALCSSADETHDAMMNIYLTRFGEQVETVTTATLFEDWPAARRKGLIS